MRKNENGKLFALNYNKVVALDIDPIEKKPLFHFLPGTKTLSLATPGCNFRCMNCQNFRLSQEYEEISSLKGEVQGEKVVEIALQKKVPSLSYTYTEPTIFLEYAIDTMKLAKEKDLKNIWVSNGFLSKKTIEMIAPYLDAINIDIKSFSNSFYKKNCNASLLPILRTAKLLKDRGVWVEITTLIIPNLSDKKDNLTKIARFIKRKLGKDTPWHISRFTPSISWKLKDIPETPLKSLEDAYNIGKKEGLNYIYVGNTGKAIFSDTSCPFCGKTVVKRSGYNVKILTKDSICPDCNNKMELL